LVWAHHRVMPELFSMISTSCHFLCDELNVDCGSLSLGEIRNDIESLRVEALEQYIDTLDKVGFDATVTHSLIPSTASHRPIATGSTSSTASSPSTASTRSSTAPDVSITSTPGRWNRPTSS